MRMVISWFKFLAKKTMTVVYSDGYWVEHDAFYLSSGEHQVLNVGIAEMSAASSFMVTVRDFDTDELIPYAEMQLNCEQASDWDHTGELVRTMCLITILEIVMMAS